LGALALLANPSSRQRVRAGRRHEPLGHPVVDVMEPVVERASELLADLAQCLEVDEAELDPDNPTATSPTFTSSNDETVTAEVSLIPSSGDASRALEILQGDAAPGCYAEAIKAETARNLAVSDDVPENVEVGEPTFNRISFESLGDESVAFRTTIPVSVEAVDVALYIDFVLVPRMLDRGVCILCAVGGSCQQIVTGPLAGRIGSTVARLR
jgi:hypothetical protein